MRHPFLKYRRRISRELVVILKGGVRPIHLARFACPKTAISKEIAVACHSASERQPLHIVGAENVVLERKIHAGMRRRRGDDGGQMRRKLLKNRPLVKSRIR